MGMGRNERENHAVEAYLQFLTTGELPTDPNKEARLEALGERIKAEPILYRKAQLVGQRHELANEGVTGDDLRRGFVANVKGFMARNPKVTYAVWREMGVPAAVLKEAKVEGVKPAREPRPPGVAPRTRRNLNDPDLAREMLSYAMANGPDATAEHYAYKRSYVGTACRDLAKRFPKIAAELGYQQEVVFPYKNPHQHQADKARKAKAA